MHSGGVGDGTGLARPGPESRLFPGRYCDALSALHSDQLRKLDYFVKSQDGHTQDGFPKVCTKLIFDLFCVNLIFSHSLRNAVLIVGSILVLLYTTTGIK